MEASLRALAVKFFTILGTGKRYYRRNASFFAHCDVEFRYKFIITFHLNNSTHTFNDYGQYSYCKITARNENVSISSKIFGFQNFIY